MRKGFLCHSDFSLKYGFSLSLIQACLPVPIFAGHTDFDPQSRFWKMGKFLGLADFDLFCFRRYSGILPAFCTYRQSRRYVAAINSQPYVMNQCSSSMSLYKKFPGYLEDLESVVNRGSGSRQYLFSMRFVSCRASQPACVMPTRHPRSMKLV